MKFAGAPGCLQTESAHHFEGALPQGRAICRSGGQPCSRPRRIASGDNATARSLVAVYLGYRASPSVGSKVQAHAQRDSDAASCLGVHELGHLQPLALSLGGVRRDASAAAWGHGFASAEVGQQGRTPFRSAGARGPVCKQADRGGSLSLPGPEVRAFPGAARASVHEPRRRSSRWLKLWVRSTRWTPAP